jgi:peptidyl-prolyl cis-trans isomerase B (cyclophilin B)
MIRLHTTKGVIGIELDLVKAPETAANFLQYVQEGFYEGTLFHRVIPGFMIQGGGLLPGMTPKRTRPPIKNEASSGLKNVVGSVAMARTSAPHSATSQFFINVNNNDFLNYPGRDGWGYCVFGQVVEGMEVINAIAAAPTTSRQGHENVPVDDIMIEKAEVVGA